MVYDKRSHTVILVRLSYSYITCVEGDGLATQLSLHVLRVCISLIFLTLNNPTCYRNVINTGSPTNEHCTGDELILVVLQMNIVQVMN